MLINEVGFISYLIFTFASYTTPAVIQAYKRHTGFPPQVEIADVLFAGHGAIMCTVIVCQLFYYPPRKIPNAAVLVITMTVQALVLVGLLACVLDRLDWYMFLSFIGMVKVLASLVKHFPQAFLNRSRQSTVGWSYTTVLLDVVGGSFSVAQQVVQSIRLNSLAPFTSNYAKTFLAAESLAFDVLFIAQHVLWYTDRRDIDLEESKGVREDQSLIPNTTI